MLECSDQILPSAAINLILATGNTAFRETAHGHISWWSDTQLVYDGRGDGPPRHRRCDPSLIRSKNSAFNRIDAIQQFCQFRKEILLIGRFEDIKHLQDTVQERFL